MSTLTVSSAISTGITLTDPVLVTNSGAVTSSGSAAVTGTGQFGTLTNAGTISGAALGVSLSQGGTLDNLSGGRIYGAAGVVIEGLGEIDNAGIIAGAGGGLILGTAALTNELSGQISGGVTAGTGTLINEGTIARAAGALVSFSDGGTVLNLGAAAALTGGDVIGVAIYGGAGSVDNQGVISGIELGDGGTISNAGYVETGSASSGIMILGAAGEVQNTGTIVGISLTGGGQIYNQVGGTVTGYLDGIDLTAGGTVTNNGRVLGIGARLSAIEPGQNGISLAGPGVIDNETGALIQGSNDGVRITGTGTGSVTLINHGTIIGKKGIIVDSSFATTIIDYGTIAGTNGTAIAFEAGDNTLILQAGAVLQGIVVGGNTTQDAALTIDGSFSSGSGGIELLAGGSLSVDGSMAAAQTISFAGTDATLMIGDLNRFWSEVDGLNPADTIDLGGESFDSSGYAKLTTDNVLEIVANNSTMSLQLDPTQNFTGEFFHISSDGLNGTDITESSVPCFLAGTRIATGDGEVSVEALKIGDAVLTGGGALKPVKWIGRRRYTAPLPDDPDVIPVLIEAGALADGVPAADLYISPRHAVRIGAVLVPAGALINGVSVRGCPEIETIAYYHIELETHETILANGLEAETFIDHESRRMFENSEEFYRLYPNAWAAEVVLCAPRLEFGPELEAARRQVALRAGLLPGQSAEAQVIGFLERADRTTITGWAYAPGQPNVPVVLDIFNRGAKLARTVANSPRPDVRNAGFGHGRCGFSLTLPAPLPALQRHEITVRPAGGGASLAGGPVVIDPGVAHDLIKAGGLRTLIDAALQGLGPGREAAHLGSSLEAAGRQIRLTAEAPFRPRKASSRSGGPVALLLDAGWPTVTRDAGSNAIMSHVEALLHLGYDVAFCATGGPPENEDAAAGLDALQQRGVRCHGHDGETAEDTLRALGAGRLDVVYLHRLAAASAYGGLVRQHAPDARVIYSVADLHHVRLARQAAVTRRPDLAAKARSVKAAELWAMQLSDCVLTHSRAEAAYLRHEAPRANVHVVPWAVPARPTRPGRHRNDIAFIGGAGHAPNLDALTHLARDVMPAVWQQIPTLRCLVAGAGWSQNLFGSCDPRLVNLGQQQDLAAVLQGVRLTVAPLRFGAGIKGKVLDSLAAGVPCVMTTIAAEGLPLDPQLRDAVGDGPDFARHVISVYRDKKLNRVLARAGLDMIETDFSEDAVATALERALGRVPRRGTKPSAMQQQVLQDA